MSSITQELNGAVNSWKDLKEQVTNLEKYTLSTNSNKYLKEIENDFNDLKQTVAKIASNIPTSPFKTQLAENLGTLEKKIGKLEERIHNVPATFKSIEALDQQINDIQNKVRYLDSTPNINCSEILNQSILKTDSMAVRLKKINMIENLQHFINRNSVDARVARFMITEEKQPVQPIILPDEFNFDEPTTVASSTAQKKVGPEHVLFNSAPPLVLNPAIKLQLMTNVANVLNEIQEKADTLTAIRSIEGSIAGEVQTQLYQGLPKIFANNLTEEQCNLFNAQFIEISKKLGLKIESWNTQYGLSHAADNIVLTFIILQNMIQDTWSSNPCLVESKEFNKCVHNFLTKNLTEKEQETFNKNFIQESKKQVQVPDWDKQYGLYNAGTNIPLMLKLLQQMGKK